jgi:hypothetical protein
MADPVVKSKPFAAMDLSEKAVFCVKLCLFLATFGFAFPTLLTD